jgi:hypothetical protein
MILDPASPRDEILRTCRLLIEPGDIHELRIPKSGRRGTISGYFNDSEKLADAALSVDGDVPAIYVTLNPCIPALLARAANRLRDRAESTTTDVDILRRRWLLLDFDPIRPSGVSSTDREHGRAIAVACAAWDHLKCAGFPDPVVADSGNGAHLLYSLKRANDSQTNDLIKKVLAGVAARCAAHDIAVDQSVFNAARITKLYGTKVCKGDSLPERPHRRSRILEIPDRLAVLEVR